jgi:hypothetical protein
VFSERLHHDPRQCHYPPARFPAAEFTLDDQGVTATVAAIAGAGLADYQRAAGSLADTWDCVTIRAEQQAPGLIRLRGLHRDPLLVPARIDLSGTAPASLTAWWLGWADDDPVQRVTTYAPWELAKGTGLLAEEVGHPYGIHGLFEDQGHVMTRIREEVSARMPRPEERRDLRLPPGVPVLDVLHTSLDQQGQPYELTRFVMRADLTGLLYDVPVE